jgi:hypothetical protein
VHVVLDGSFGLLEFGFGGGGLVAVEPSGIEDIMWGGRTDVVAVAVPQRMKAGE